MTVPGESPLGYPINSQPSIRRIVRNRAPTSNDNQNFREGDEWLDKSSNDWYKLADITGSTSTWVLIGGTAGAAEEFIPDTGTSPVVPNSSNQITITGGNGIQTTGGTNTITYAMESPFTGDFVFTGRLTAEFFETENTTTGLTITDNSITADGTDSNIDLRLIPKGTGGTYTDRLKVNYAGATNAFTINGVSVNADVIACDSGSSTIIEYLANSISNTAATGPRFLGARSRESGGNPAIVQENDSVLDLFATGFDGTDYALCAEIKAQVDGSPGSNDMPGRLVFLTSPDGSQTPAECLRIDSNKDSRFSGSVLVNYTESDNTVTIGGTSFTSDIITGDAGTANVLDYTALNINNVAADGAILALGRSRESGGNRAIVQNNDDVFRLVGLAFDGTDYAISSEIRSEIDNTPGAGDAPGRLVFLTTPDGSETASEVLRLDSSQNATFTNNISTTGGSVTIDPGASGDSFIQYNINTTGEFRVGVDDNAGDSYKISQGSALGTNDTFIMTSAGERTMPLQPAFMAWIGTTTGGVTGAGTNYQLVSFTEAFDQNADFNASTGVFTAPVTGRYFFHASVRVQSLTAAMSAGNLLITPSTSNRNFSVDYFNIGAVRDGSNQASIEGSCTIDLAATDTVVFTVQVSGGAGDSATIAGDATNQISYVQGWLIC